MGFMKGKKGVLLVLIAGVLISLGCKNIETVQANSFIFEQNGIAAMSTSQNITEKQAKEIAIKSFESYFDENIDIENLFEEIELWKAGDEYNFENKDHWSVVWSTFDFSRIDNREGMTENEIKQLNEDHQNATVYYAKIEEKTGEVMELAKIDGKRDNDLSVEEIREKGIEIEDVKNITLDFIEKNKPVDNVGDLEFLGEIRLVPELCNISYKYGEDKVITVFVESLSKRVVGFKYENEQEVKDAIENNKSYKINNPVG